VEPSYRKTTAVLLRLGIIAFALTVAYLLFRGAIHTRAQSLLDPYSFSGDALQHIPPFWLAHEQSLFTLDYIRGYYWNALFPPLFKASYWLLTFLAEPAAASKIISCLLAVVFVGTVTRASYILAGGSAAFVTLLLATGGTLKNFPFMSGLQRGFGTWLCSLMLLFLISGNILALGVTIVVTAMFYPAAAVFGLTTFGLVLCLPGRFIDSRHAWTLRRRVITLGVFAALTGIAVLPQLSAGAHYGERLSIENAQEFEEWGPNGRYTQGDRGVPMSFTKKFLENSMAYLLPGKLSRAKRSAGNGDSLFGELSRNDLLHREFFFVLVGSLLGALILYRRAVGRFPPAAARVGAYTVAIAVSFAAATLLFPLLYIPTRYVVVTLPALIPILFPAVWTKALATLFKLRFPRAADAIAACAGVAALALVGWFSLSVRPMPTAAGHRELFAYIRSLPQESVIAGWPRGAMDTIGLFTGRRVVLHEESHQIFHRDFLVECRKRMRAIIRLYASSDAAALEELRREYGVTHLLVDRKHLKNAPSYFAPFKEEMLSALANNPDGVATLKNFTQAGTVFRLRNISLVDLAKIGVSEESSSNLQASAEPRK